MKTGEHDRRNESLLARLVWILVILCSVRVKKERIYNEGELDSGTTPLAPEENPRPTFREMRTMKYSRREKEMAPGNGSDMDLVEPW